MHYLIDGYNLLHAMGAIPRRAGPHGLEKARLRLLGLLQGAYGDAAGEVTVVFDAAHPPPGAAEEEDFHGIHVRFAVRYDQADELIESIVRHHSAPKQLTVVSDDRRIRQAARHRRCPALACLDYLDELQRRRHPRPPKITEEKQAVNSPEEVEEWVRQFADVNRDPAVNELEFPYNLEAPLDADES